MLLIDFLRQTLIAPFEEFAFMRRALLICLCLSWVNAPIGVFLLLRRLSLLGDSLSHAILPGTAIGFMIGGFSAPYLIGGGFIAGVAVTLLSSWVSTKTELREDSAFASFYLGSLALGVLLISVNGTQVDLTHVLFGSVLGVDQTSLNWTVTLAAVVLITLLLLGRVFVMEVFDPSYLLHMKIQPKLVQTIFLLLVVTTLLASFQTLGTLLSVGLMIVPAATSRMLTSKFSTMVIVAGFIGMVSSIGGLLFSYHLNWPAGPVIVLSATVIYGAAIFSRHPKFQNLWRKRRHFER